MILRRQPKNRNAFHATCSRQLGEFHGSKRLENGEKRATKKADLLSSHNGQRASTKPIQIRQRLP